MTYRADLDALRAKRDALRASTEDDPNAAESLRDIEREIERLAAEGRRALLRNVKVAAPCPAKWEFMVGTDRVRQCALCEKNVYDTRGLTADEILALLARDGDPACLRLHRRRDGTLITADCLIGRSDRRRRVAKASGVALAAAGLAAWSLTSEPARASLDRVPSDAPSFSLDDQRYFGAQDHQRDLAEEVEVFQGQAEWSPYEAHTQVADMTEAEREAWLNEQVDDLLRLLDERAAPSIGETAEGSRSDTASTPTLRSAADAADPRRLR